MESAGGPEASAYLAGMRKTFDTEATIRELKAAGMGRRQAEACRKGVWSLTVTRNWRLTFRIDRVGGEIVDLDYEDYH